MSNLAFSPELRTMAIVPRWTIVWTLSRDYVSSHSYFVSIYTHDVARLICWQGPYDALMYFALTHDLEETISGDLASPVKREIIDQARATAYFDVKMNQRMPSIMRHIDYYVDRTTDLELEQMQAIITVADRLDALLFLITEQRLGNTFISPRMPEAESRLEAAWFELPGERDNLQLLWNTSVLPSIAAHRGQGGFGI